MQWIKKGQIFTVTGNFGWMNSHAQVPTVVSMGETLRIFFSTRTHNNHSKIGVLDVKTSNPKIIKSLSKFEVIQSGSSGSFDENGVMPSCAFMNSQGGINLYYSGWGSCTSYPYSNLTGLAVSTSARLDKFNKISSEPILKKNIKEPYSLTSPYIIFHNDTYYAFYCSGTNWVSIENRLEHVYDIKMAVSFDGVLWNHNSISCIKQSNPYEAITRPTVIKINEIFHMWFCYRGSRNFRDGNEAYRIGYAYSNDLMNWTRDDALAGIKLSDSGWDSKMICYPYVVETVNGIYMFYNGNGFGKEGFGYAVLKNF
jgi:hypothetical protein